MRKTLTKEEADSLFKKGGTKIKMKSIIENKKFKDIRTGEIVTQFNLKDIKYMVEE